MSGNFCTNLYLLFSPLDLFGALTVLVVLTVLFWLLYAFDQSHRSWWLATAIGPIGALLRYFLSQYNHHTPNFPTFTFIANFLAVLANIVIVGVHNAVAVSNNRRTKNENLLTGTK